MRNYLSRMFDRSSSATRYVLQRLRKRQAAVDAILVYYARLLVRASQPGILR